MKKSILGLACALTFSATAAYAQTASTSTTTTASSNNGVVQSSSTETTTTESTGTISEYTPGSAIVLNTGSGAPVHYKFSKSVTYVTPDGQVLEASKVRKDSHVKVHYVKEGNDMMVDKVVVMP